jgi:D-alanyl-D-alanine carboxypeptidase
MKYFYSIFLLLILNVISAQNLERNNQLSNHIKEYYFTRPSLDLFSKIGEKVQQTEINYFSNLDPELEKIFNGIIDSTFREYQPIGISAEVRLGEDKYWKASMGISHGQTKINPDDIMGIASMTKLFTAAAILKFAEEGKLKLTDSIKKYLPNQKNVNLNATVYQLLNMTAGHETTNNPNFWNVVLRDSNRVWTAQQILDTFNLRKPLYSAGAKFYYSNTNYIILAIILEKVSGKFYHEVIKEKILQAHNLNHTFLFPQEKDILPIHYWSYYDLTSGSFVDFADPADDPFYHKPFFSAYWSSGAYFSNLDDMSRWLRILDKNFLSPEFKAKQKEIVFPFGTQDFGYGLGLSYEKVVGHDFYGHDGNLFYNASGAYCPDWDASFVVLNNDGRETWINDPLFYYSLVLKYRLINAYKLWLDIGTGTHYSLKNSDLKLSPNPCKDFIQIDIPSADYLNTNMSILNALGNRLSTFQINEEKQKISIHHLQPGLYYLETTKRGGTIGLQKFIVLE